MKSGLCHRSAMSVPTIALEPMAAAVGIRARTDKISLMVPYPMMLWMGIGMTAASAVLVVSVVIYVSTTD